MPRRLLVPALSLVLALSVGPAAPVAHVDAAPGCDSFETPALRDPATPTFPFGEHQMTVEEIDAYLTAVDTASDRVMTAEAAKSVKGTSLRYAVVGTPEHLADLAGIKSRLALLQDPLADEAEVAAAAEDTPAILWVAANVHGGEESGADASLHALYELASRSDCVVDQILANALVVILPTQNPDGREIGQRRNLNGFDMNRDWFARTQPETDGKLDVVREYPPTLFIDAHEFGLADYFFPPNADPEYHEIPDQAHEWINEKYSPAIVSQFTKEGIKFFHGAPYDFFAVVFGDTVPATAYGAAGMTFEKQSSDPISEREHEHFTSIWASLAAGAAEGPQMLLDWHQSWVDAYEEGVEGKLEGNAVFEPKHKLFQNVPDLTVRGYFIANDADRAYETQLLIRRLQRMGVEVRQLTASLALADFHPYGDDGRSAVMPAGTYWISMAQAKKHWIQAMLNEEVWIPFDVTYDVTAWSNPLLMNLRGGWSGDVVTSTNWATVGEQAQPHWTETAEAEPGVLLLENDRSTRGYESAGQTDYLFDLWGLPFDHEFVSEFPVTATSLAPYDVVVLPDGFANYALQDLGSKGKKALRDWVNSGGRIVAWQGGALVASRAGISTAQFSTSNTNAPGALVRVSLDPSSPLADGVGATDWVMYQDDDVMKPGLGRAFATFPSSSSDDFATSGLTLGINALAGTAAVADEAVGQGRVVSFSFDPNFRAWTQGTQRLLWNAIVGSDPAFVGTAPLAGSKERAAAEKAALDSAAKVVDFGSAIRVRVKAADAAATAKILARHGAEVARVDLGGEVLFLVANRKDLSAEESTLFAPIIRNLEKAGIDVLAASVP
ncbi:MAG TPA: M14 family zinc carboxypeptidase [Candidatus Limnocylindrales bacterium]|nr:M14 family zinc carboxypeptidase [Candidatus Limnocylindrales bacterium]